MDIIQLILAPKAITTVCLQIIKLSPNKNLGGQYNLSVIKVIQIIRRIEVKFYIIKVVDAIRSVGGKIYCR